MVKSLLVTVRDRILYVHIHVVWPILHSCNNVPSAIVAMWIARVLPELAVRRLTPGMINRRNLPSVYGNECLSVVLWLQIRLYDVSPDWRYACKTYPWTVNMPIRRLSRLQMSARRISSLQMSAKRISSLQMCVKDVSLDCRCLQNVSPGCIYGCKTSFKTVDVCKTSLQTADMATRRLSRLYICLQDVSQDCRSGWKTSLKTADVSARCLSKLQMCH